MEKKVICKRECDHIICSIALEEAALAHILNAEGEKIQKAVSIATTVDELLKINCSVENMITNVTNLEITLFGKLRSALCCNCICPPIPPEPPIPPIPPKPPCRYRIVRVEGVVYDSRGNKICNAQVCAFGKNTKTVKTNECGYYIIEDLRVCDSFSIFAECNNYRSILITNYESRKISYIYNIQIRC